MMKKCFLAIFIAMTFLVQIYIWFPIFPYRQVVLENIAAPILLSLSLLSFQHHKISTGITKWHYLFVTIWYIIFIFIDIALVYEVGYSIHNLFSPIMHLPDILRSQFGNVVILILCPLLLGWFTDLAIEQANELKDK
ncbi:TPA: hypothetical protein U2D59_000748 [Streptococcus suis]|uniref:hypothetical protein n=1 Tax=Streptococcus suis TaxID=1307 RepID=UPI002AAEFE62|nr:hypothetical protein [Streptococcus suis]HEM5935491.1 hypothetical protein [Streptococcus suis]HEM5939501.1 hypothetical protein [Streptococcus suis]HEM5945947.1 hypothetical protein [Streptococcus suis]HEM5950115.1 hypothetical protein [Streptococcus suis]